MRWTSFQFLSATCFCSEVNDVSKLFTDRNSIYYYKSGATDVNFDGIDFMMDDDDGIISELPLVKPIHYKDFSQHNTETFIAGIDNAKVDHWPYNKPEARSYNIYIDSKVAIADNYENAERSEQMALYWSEAIWGHYQDRSFIVPFHVDRTPDRLFNDTFFVLCTRCSVDNYFHWLWECFTRLWPITAGLIDSSVPILFPTAELRPFHQQALEIAGITNPLVSISTTTPKFRKLIVPSFIAPGGPTPERVQWLRDIVLTKAKPDDTPPTRRIYLSRPPTMGRSVDNEEAILDILAGYGFEIVRPETLTLMDQARLFHQAKIVLGPHGAGFTNMVFCRPGAIVAEFVSEASRPVLFWTMAKAAGLKYGRMIAALKEERFQVDHDKLRRFLDVICAAG